MTARGWGQEPEHLLRESASSSTLGLGERDSRPLSSSSFWGQGVLLFLEALGSFRGCLSFCLCHVPQSGSNQERETTQEWE